MCSFIFGLPKLDLSSCTLIYAPVLSRAVRNQITSEGSSKRTSLVVVEFERDWGRSEAPIPPCLTILIMSKVNLRQ
jgi:hypothetical protein